MKVIEQVVFLIPGVWLFITVNKQERVKAGKHKHWSLISHITHPTFNSSPLLNDDSFCPADGLQLHLKAEL